MSAPTGPADTPLVERVAARLNDFAHGLTRSECAVLTREALREIADDADVWGGIGDYASHLREEARRG